MARICSQPFNSLLFKYSNRFAKDGSQPMFISHHRLPSKSTRGLPPPPQSLQLVCCCCFCLVVFCLNAKVIPTLPPETVTTSNPPKTFFPDCQTLKSVDRLQNIKNCNLSLFLSGSLEFKFVKYKLSYDTKHL